MRGRLVRRLFVAASAVALIPACGDAGDGDDPVVAPGAFTLSSPAHMAVGQAVAPTLSWTASSGAAFYVLQISIDATFMPVIFEQWGIAATSVVPTALLGHSEAYYWRVAAVNAAGSVVASNGPFRFDTVAPPGVITAPTLAGLGSPARRVPTFAWSGGTNATTWTLQIDEGGGNFSTPVRQMSGLRASTARLDVALAAGTAFKARVLPDGDTGTPSNEINFTTETAGVGDLDTSLGGTGRLVSAFSGRANAVAVDDNGDIYLAGAVVGANFDMAVFKMRPDGSADPFFGSNGMATADFFGFNDEAIALILDGSKRPVVAGYATTGSLRGVFAMARFTTAGVLDTAFDTDGKTSFDGTDNTNVGAANGNAIARGLAPWNTSYVIGGDDDNTTNVYFVRVDADGDMDGTFGTAGVSTLNAGDSVRLSSLKAEGTTSIVGVGSVEPVAADVDTALFKVDGAGAGVAGFGTNGLKVQALEGLTDDQGQGLVISGTEIVVAGYRGSLADTNLEPVLSRYQLSDGALIETTLLSHGGAGFVGLDSANAVAGPTSGNHFILAGLAGPSNGTLQNFGFFRVETDGDVDATFGSNGRHFDLGSGAGEQALAVVIDLEGRILAAGISGGRMALVRLFNAP